jgi:hypothetical protein
MVYTYEKSTRCTRLGGLTAYIAVCLECKKVIKPSRARLSRSGTHGTEYYSHQHPLVFIELNQSNSGNRTISIPNELSEIKEDLERMWIYENSSVEDIKSYVMTYLKTLSLAQKIGEESG